MDFAAMAARALEIRAQFERVEQRRYGRSWSTSDTALGLVGDVGDLVKLIQAHEGVRAIDDTHRKLEHEFADVLWSVIVLARACGVELESAFVRTMDEIENALGGER